MTEQRFVVPRLRGSRWDDPRRPKVFAGLEWPRVGIYCQHPGDPWLVGSLVLSPEVLEQRGERYWGWSPDYLTGDGYLIRLNAQSGKSEPQQLVGDSPRDRAAEKRSLAQALRQVEHGHIEAATDHLAKADRVSAELRLRIPLNCGACNQPQRLRSSTVQPIAETLWEFGIREISMDLFMARVRRARA